MEITMKLLVIAVAVISMALAPSLVMINSVDASTHYCRDYPGKSQNWINGCQQGWWDHNHCQDYSSGSGQYAQGYNVGWSKGHCK